MSSDKDWVCVGKIGGPHGIGGDVKVHAYTEQPIALGDFRDLRISPDLKKVRISSLRQANKGGLIARIEGCEGRNAAEALRGLELLVPRDAFPEPQDDEYYLVDLEGLEAVDLAGAKIGKVKAVVNYGAGDLVVLTLDEPRKGVGTEAILPFRKAIFPDVNLADGQVTVVMDDWLEALREGVAEQSGTEEGESK